MQRIPPANFTSKHFLKQHIADTLAFYDKNALDPEGGFFHYLKDDGSIYNRSHRHLVSAARFVFTQAMAFEHTGQQRYRNQASHALAHVLRFCHQHGPVAGLYAWTIEDGQIADGSVMAYGQAFVLLAMAHAYRIGLCDEQAVSQAFDRMEHTFYHKLDQAYADEITPQGTMLDYRGQNANMHMCEACLAAYQATGLQRYLLRAQELIERFVFCIAPSTYHLVWEHYHRDWSVDWDYNKHNPHNIFKPWGFQTGHQTEWAKLLLIAHHHAPDARYVEQAIALERAAWQYGWDADNGGLIYGFAPDFTACDSNKYFWVQAESLACAWRLWRMTQETTYREHYQQLWQWSWHHLVDHTYGAWFRMVLPDGTPCEDTKSPAGKVDYHTLGACWDVLAGGGLAT